MIGDFSLTVMNYIYWLNCKSLELFSVAFGVELNDTSDLEISLIVALKQWVI